jgi:hypothetical protein
MKRLRTIGITAGFGLVLLASSGCTITQDVKPVTPLSTNEVCIIDNPAVKSGFLQAYTDTLQRNGYKARVLPEKSGVDACKVTSTFIGRWSWDMAIYLSYADIKVYEDGKLSGSVLYDARSGGARVFDKFVNGESKVSELVTQLFPPR